MNHQTLGRWDEGLKDPAYYIENCRICKHIRYFWPLHFAMSKVFTQAMVKNSIREKCEPFFSKYFISYCVASKQTFHFVYPLPPRSAYVICECLLYFPKKFLDSFTFRQTQSCTKNKMAFQRENINLNFDQVLSSSH